MEKKYLFIILLTILTSKGFSQSNNYTKGYVIKESRDTIFGELKNMGEERSCFKIKFIDANGNKVKFKIKDIYAYKRGDEVYFKKSYVRPISFKQGFMKLIENGVIKLFQFNYVAPNLGTMNTNNAMMVDRKNYQQDYYIEKNDNLLLIKKMGFKKTMAKYFSDNTELANKIRNKELKYKDLKEIVKIYNKSKE